jgi:serine protease Do
MRKCSSYIAGLFLSVMLLVTAGVQPGLADSEQVAMVPANFTQLAEEAAPGVVNIRTVRTIKGGGRVFRHFFGEPFGGRRHPFDDFFGPNQNDPGREHKERSLGSGFIIDKEGYIVTNNHVVADADQIKVKLSNNKEYNATIVGRDSKTDLALIKIEDVSDLQALPLGDSEKLKVGTWVVAIGSPFGLEQTVTAGIVSAKERIIGAGPYDDFIQTDASINPGNSGGPLINLKGQVVGINTAIVARGQGIGFAIPVNMAKRVVAQLKERGEVTRGWLGVQIRDLDENLSSYYQLKPFSGVFVEKVVPGDPADQAGIKASDIIISVDGQAVASGRELATIVANTPVGQKTEIRLIRDGKKKTIVVKVAKQADDKVQMASKDSSRDELGLEVAELTTERARQFGLDEDDTGVLVIEVERNSKADKAGMSIGDIIKGINRKKVKSIEDYQRLMAAVDQDDTIDLLVRRRGQGTTGIQIKP